jgi:predicted Zn-dependent protease
VAEQLVAGRLDRGDFLALYALEDGAAPPGEKVALARQLVARRPELPAARLHLGENLVRIDRKEEAREAYRAGLTRDVDPDVRTRLVAELATITEDADERTRLYREAAALNGNLVAAASALLALRAT